MGLLCLGWLSDVYGGPDMLLLSHLSICVMLGMIARQRSPLPIIGLVAMIAFTRGIVWPAATKSMNTYLKAKQWEVGLCLIGLASRVGDLLTSEIVGLLEVHVGWRGAIYWIAGITGSAVCICWLVIRTAHKMRKEVGVRRCPEVETGRAQALADSRWDNLKAFYSETD